MPEGKPPLFPDPINRAPKGESTFAPRTPRNAGSGRAPGSSGGSGDRRSGRTWRQRILVGSGFLIVLGVLAAAGVVGYGWWRWNQVGKADLALDEAEGGAAQNYLIVGSDSREVVSESDADADAFLGTDTEGGGQRSDTIMLVRVDPSAKTLDMVSFPRDLWVEIPGTTGHDKINAAYSLDDGPQRLIDTIKVNYGIDVNHYVEVDFRSFKGVVDAVGGVPMYFPDPLRDQNSGLAIEAAGCVNLDGEQALAFSRSRHLQYENDKGTWVDDPTADLGRISRQQEFIRKMIDRAAATTKGFDLKAVNSIIGSTADNITIDSGLDFSEVLSLAKNFSNFSGDQIVTHTLPVELDMTDGGASILRLDGPAAQPVFNVFRGLPADSVTLAPAQVTLRIENGSGRSGQAGEASKALSAIGFTVAGTGDASSSATRSIVRYAPGSALSANQVLMHLPSGASLRLDQTLDPGEIVLVTGSDFTTISADPVDVPPVEDDSSMQGTTTTTVDPNVISGPVGVVPGDPTDGTICAA